MRQPTLLRRALLAVAATWHVLAFGQGLRGDLGLNPANLRQGGLAVGFIPGWGENLGANSPEEINARLSAPMSIVGDYVNLETWDPNLSLMEKHLPSIKNLKGNPVWQMTLMPFEGLHKVTPEVAERIAKKMWWINKHNVTVWLSFAHEMNGEWYKWGGQPDLFIEKWRLVTKAVRSKTSRTYMLWAPNSAFGTSLDDVRGGYTKYWPGAKWVDISGMSFYHYGGFERLNVLPDPEAAVRKIKEFAGLYGARQNLPVVLSETGASYTTLIETGGPGPGGASEYDIKYEWAKQLFSQDITEEVPDLKAVVWFESVKIENAAGDSREKQEDFRLLLGNTNLEELVT